MARQGNDLVLGYAENGRPIVLPHDRRLQHTAIFGLTGTGKSKLVEHLVQQDLRAHPQTGCGLLLLDPHGQIYDNTMAWLAATRRHNLPVIPIDFTRPESIVQYNPLRRREVEPSVIIDALIRAMAHVWGQATTDASPLFEQWATNILFRLYHEGRTLADAAQMFTPDGLVAVDRIPDPVIRRDWEWARRNQKAFEENISSSVRRFRRFLLNPLLRAIFGQGGLSLDFSKALNEGHIVLVNLSRTGGAISRENADLFATLLLADLWSAADERGKDDNVKPFYVYIDEFPRFISPTIAENLAEARGFGIGMTLAAQFPKQLLNSGPYGQRVYDEVLENARSKIIFRLRSRANLEPIAESLFWDTFDPDRVKFQHYSTKVMGYRLMYLPSVGRSSSVTNGGGEQRSRTQGTSQGQSRNWSHTDTVGHSSTRSWSKTDGVSETNGEQWSNSSGETSSNGRSGGTTSGGSESRGNSAGEAKSESFGISGRELQGDGNTNFQNHFNDDGKVQSWSVGNSTNAGTNDSTGSQWGESTGWSSSEGSSSGKSRGRSRSQSTSSSETYGESETESESESDSYGGGESRGTSDATSVGESSMWAQSIGQSITLSPMLFPVMDKEASQPLFRSIDEQIFIAMAKIARLKDREAFVLVGDMEVPIRMRTADVDSLTISRTCMEICAGWYQQESGLSISLSDALARVEERDRKANVVVKLYEADNDFARPCPPLSSSKNHHEC